MSELDSNFVPSSSHENSSSDLSVGNLFDSDEQTVLEKSGASSKQNHSDHLFSALEDQKLSSGYQVVARRYRPLGFDQLVGQKHVAQALSNAITTGRIGHAYLFTGSRGVGKTSSARIFAKALNCVHGPTPSPCNECEICRSISTGEDVDVIEIDGASNRGIDEIRQLRQNAVLRPSRSRFKIYIIDEVHMLTREAFNALLKTLEEPPEHVKFIFCTTEPTKLPITILSRCQRFDFAGIESRDIAQRLALIAKKEGVSTDDGVLETLARRANGSMRDAQSLLEQLLSFAPKHIRLVDVHEMLGTADDQKIFRILDAVVKGNVKQIFETLQTAADEGVDFGVFVEQLMGFFRDLMAVAGGCDESLLMYIAPSRFELTRQIAEKLGMERILASLQVLDQTFQKMRYSTQGRILTELALVRLCSLENVQLISALIRQLTQAGKNAGAVSAGMRLGRPTGAGMQGTVQEGSDPASRYSGMFRHLAAGTPSQNDSTQNNFALNNSQQNNSVQNNLVQNNPMQNSPVSDYSAEKKNNSLNFGGETEVQKTFLSSELRAKPTVFGSSSAQTSGQSLDQISELHSDQFSTQHSRQLLNPISEQKSGSISEQSGQFLGPVLNHLSEQSSSQVSEKKNELISGQKSGQILGQNVGQTIEKSLPEQAIQEMSEMPSDLNSEELSELWRDAARDLGRATQMNAESFCGIRFQPPDMLTIQFPKDVKSSQQYCESQKLVLQSRLHQLAQIPLVLHFETVDKETTHKPQTPTVKSQETLKKEALANPMIHKACELFGAEVDYVVQSWKTND